MDVLLSKLLVHPSSVLVWGWGWEEVNPAAQLSKRDMKMQATGILLPVPSSQSPVLGTNTEEKATSSTVRSPQQN
jgi:hypothetical protein